MIKLFDGNNWVRTQFEVDPTGMALRNLFNDAYLATQPQLWIFDGKNSRAIRRKIYPGYKGKRKPGTDNFYITLDLFKQLLRYTNKVMIEVPGVEADDVIGTLVRSNPNQVFHIQSTDRDFHVLLNDRVTQYGTGIIGVDPIDTRLYKAIVKDTSDNVPGIAKFGDKAWSKLTPEMKVLWVKVLNKKIDIKNCYAEQLGVSGTQMLWCLENFELLVAFWTVVDFIEIPMETINSFTSVGKPNYSAAQDLLSQLMLGDVKPSMAYSLKGPIKDSL